MAEELSSVVYLGHIPEGFEEKEMKKFFSQFGTVKNVQLSRSPETGNSRHYGWIEFETTEVAKTVAKATNGYLLFENILECEVKPKAQLHPDLFKNARRGARKPRPVEQLTRKELALKLARQEKTIKAELAAKGINYSWPSIFEQFEKKGITIPEEPKKKAEEKPTDAPKQ